MLQTLAKKNQFPLYSVNSPQFAPYGRMLDCYDWEEMISRAEECSPIPAQGNTYVPSCDFLEALPLCTRLEERFYGGMPLQAGYCNGNNDHLNALEYHKSSEIDVAVTPLVLLLAKVQSIENNKLDTSCVEGFYLPRGTAVELYATTLHFSPCKVSDEGFKCIVILPNGTNESLPQLPQNPIAEEQLLWMRNKWLLAHPESAPAAKGAWVGLTGENLKLYYK